MLNFVNRQTAEDNYIIIEKTDYECIRAILFEVDVFDGCSHVTVGDIVEVPNAKRMLPFFELWFKDKSDYNVSDIHINVDFGKARSNNGKMIKIMESINDG